jgi:hypothetical protein
MMVEVGSAICIWDYAWLCTARRLEQNVNITSPIRPDTYLATSTTKLDLGASSADHSTANSVVL